MTYTFRDATRSEAKWLPIPSWPEYEASSDGRIRRIGAAECKRLHLSKRAYLSVSLWHDGVGKTCYAHRLICEAFHGPAPEPKMDAAHTDGNRFNNRPENLRWATRAENEADKLRHRRSNCGERNGMAKLDDSQAQELKGRAAQLPRSCSGKRIKKGALPRLAKEYGITPSGARLIISGSRRHANGV